MESHGIENDLDIQIDDIGVGTSSSTNIHNISYYMTHHQII